MELSVLYGAAEVALKLPGGEADAQRRFRAAIRAEPASPEAYLRLIKIAGVSDAEQIDLLRQLLRTNPKADDAYPELITRLSTSDANRNAGEIVGLFQQYRKIFSFEHNPPWVTASDPIPFELELFAIAGLEQAGRFTEAVGILRPIMEHGIRGDSLEICVDLLSVEPEDFRTVPDFSAELAKFKKYCTERDHEFASIKLKHQGKLRDAAQELELQIRTNPRYPLAFPELSSLYLELGQTKEAVRVLKEFLRGEWSDTTKCRTLAYEHLGNLDQYRVDGDDTVDRIRSECKSFK